MKRITLVALDSFIEWYLEHPKNTEKVITKERLIEVIGNKNQYYRDFKIPKKTGGFRKVKAPFGHLKVIQEITKELLEEFYDLDQIPSNVFGFVEGRGIKDNASLHTNKKYVLNVDLLDFFGSIKVEKILERLSFKPFSIHRESIISRIIAEIVTVEGSLPVGAPTSPVVSNIVMKEFDYSMVMFAKKKGLVYSRYADDLTFSTNKNISYDSIVNNINARVKRFNFSLNSKKTRLQCSGSRQIVTGLVVNNKVSVKKEFLSLTRCMLNNWRVYGLEEAQKRYDLKKSLSDGKYIDNVLRGRIDFIGYILNPSKNKFHPTYISLFKQFWTLNYKIDYSFVVNDKVRDKLVSLNYETELIASDKLTAESQEIRFKSYCFNIFRQIEILYKYFYFVKEKRDNGKVMLFFCNNHPSIMRRFYPNKGEIGKKVKKIIGRDLNKKISYDDLSNLELDDIARFYASNCSDLSKLKANELEARFLSEPYNLSSKKTTLFEYLRDIRNHYAHASDHVFSYERKKVFQEIKAYEAKNKIKITEKSKIDRGDKIFHSFITWKKYFWLDECNFDEVRDLLSIVAKDVQEIERKYAPNNAPPSTGPGFY